MLRAMSLLFVLLLAGCASSPDAPAASSTSSSTASGTTSSATGAEAQVASPVVQRIDWNDSLDAGAWACDYTVTRTCHSQPQSAFGVSHRVVPATGTTLGGNLTLEWTAGPLTEELVLELLVWVPDCDDCNFTYLGAYDGASPITHAFDPGLVMEAGMVLDIAVYSALYQYQPNVAVGTSGEQDFRVRGDLSILPS